MIRSPRRRSQTSQAMLHGGWARLVRGSVLGASCLTVSMAAHAPACGVVLDVGLLLCGALAFGLGMAWAQRRARPVTLVAFVLGMQVLLHVVSVAAGAHHRGTGLIPSPSMVAWHAMAAVLMAMLLVRADTIAHRWAAFLRALRSPMPVLPVIACPGTALILVDPAPHAWLHDPARSIPRRGPPPSK